MSLKSAPLRSCQTYKKAIRHIIEVVCRAFEVTPEEITVPSRCWGYTTPRGVSAYIIHKLTNASLRNMEVLFQQKYSNIHRAIKKVQSNEALRKYADELAAQLEADIA